MAQPQRSTALAARGLRATANHTPVRVVQVANVTCSFPYSTLRLNHTSAGAINLAYKYTQAKAYSDLI